ncbi:MAG: hypothetical protein QG597_1628 [Actinomycetota bacterium]|nr:hypothetical protein [Actinomycetota bacterium]
MTPVGTIPDLIDTIEHIADEHRTDRRCVTTISTGLDTLYVELSERAFDICTRCGQNLPPAGPVAWLDERTGAHQGDYDQQHGCGEWNSPESLLIKIDLDTLADMDEGDVDTTVRDRLTAAASKLDGAVAAATAAETARIRADLANDLRATLSQVADISADTSLTAEEKAEAFADLEDGAGEDPGVYRDGGQWQAWAWVPRRESCESIIVTECDL